MNEIIEKQEEGGVKGTRTGVWDGVITKARLRQRSMNFSIKAIII